MEQNCIIAATLFRGWGILLKHLTQSEQLKNWEKEIVIFKMKFRDEDHRLLQWISMRMA